MRPAPLVTWRARALAGLLLLASGAAIAQDAPPAEITLQRIMADPDWIGNPPRNPYWAADDSAVFYLRKRLGEAADDLVRIDLETGVESVVPDAEAGRVDSASGDWSGDRGAKVYTRRGDVFWKDVRSGEIRQLTRTAASESRAHFLADERRIAFYRGTDVFIRDLDTGLEAQVAELLPEDDPAEQEAPDDYLSRQQPRLLDWVRESQERDEAERERERTARHADPTRLAPPFYLGKKTRVVSSHLSPDGTWMLLRTAAEDRDRGRRDTMPNYVSEDGYVSVREVRPKVGTVDERGDRLVALDLAGHTRHELDLSALPGITDDPLEELRRQAEQRRQETATAEASEVEGEGEGGDEAEGEDPEPGTEPGGDEAREPRAVFVSGEVQWAPSGRRAALVLRSADNKDRWIAVVEWNVPTEAARGEPELRSVHRLSDPAWINWSFNDFGWLGEEHLYFLSEESGFSHLYLHGLDDGTTRPLTAGNYVVDRVTPSPDERYLYFTANAEHPGVYEVHRVEVESGAQEQLTALGGRNTYVLSPSGEQLLLRHSALDEPPELYRKDARPGAEAQRLTQTVSEAFSALPWVTPKVVPVPSSHHDRPIWSRFYAASSNARNGPDGRRPAVVFVHGAGYLQNAHLGWSSYFREHMFHSLLSYRGYAVLDMDYRASRGYGRDWRTAIYRQMGTPELEDLADGAAWLVAEQGVDPGRIGIYGGSYGGFMTFMALFKSPDLFAAGAALRPVTDWAHYNHPYTSNILNTPDLDPEAYEKSSPIEFAEGLSKPLLICAGMQDDNVFFQDTVRLVQRLIELEKEHWELAIYPVEPHAFREPSSWLDEYRRVLRLFETHLAPP